MLKDKELVVKKTQEKGDLPRRKAAGLRSPADLKRIAISMEGTNVSRQFGRCEKFCIVNVAEQQVISRQFINNPVHISDFMPDFMEIKNVDCVVTGGISKKEIEMLNSNGISVITGAKGSVENVIRLFIKGELKTINKVS